MQQSFLSKLPYWAPVSITLLVFSLSVLLFVYPVDEALGSNLLGSAIFAAIAIFFIEGLPAALERRRRKGLKTEIIKELGEAVYHICITINKMVEHKSNRSRWSRKRFYGLIEDLSKKRSVELSGWFEENFPEPAIWDFGVEIEDFFKSPQYLAEIQTTFPEFIDPQVHISLLKIRHHIESMSHTVRFMKEQSGFGYGLEDVRKWMSGDIVGIAREALNVREMEVEVYYGNSR